MIKEKKIEGLSEVMDALKDIKVKVKVQLIKSFLRKAMMKEIIKPLRADLPYSRNIIKNIKIFTSRRDSNKTAIYGGPSSDVYWIRFMEKGTKQRYTKKGAFRGSIRAHKIGRASCRERV